MAAAKEDITPTGLPRTLRAWRCPEPRDPDEIWSSLHTAFAEQGYTLWDRSSGPLWLLLEPSGREQLSSGFGYATPLRGSGNKLGYIEGLAGFAYSSPLVRAARTTEGHDVVVRVLSIGEQGLRHTKILKKIAQGKQAFLSNNHTIPMFAELAIQDITFGVFPKVGYSLDYAYGLWAKNSVGDIIDMIMQALEGLAFIHSLGIAHRDVFKSNFVIQWFPESLTAKSMSVSRPRVYLIDFEVAVEFPADCPKEQRVCVGIPIDGSLTDPDTYVRQRPPEVESGEPYDPFKLDVWQLGASFADFSSSIEDIDNVLIGLIDANVETRLTAAQALAQLVEHVSAVPPKALLIPPIVYDLSFPVPKEIHTEYIS